MTQAARTASPSLGLPVPWDFEMDRFTVLAGLRDLGKHDEVPDAELDETCARLERHGLHTRAIAGPGRGASVVYFARRAAALEEVYNLERAQRSRRSAARRARACRKLGTLLGYPSCCVQAFVESSRQDDADAIFRLPGGLSCAAPALMNFFPKGATPTGFVPCSFECEAAAKHAEAVATAMGELHGVDAAQIASALAGAVLWWSEQHFLLFHEVEILGDDSFSFAGVSASTGLLRLQDLPAHRRPSMHLRALAYGISRGDRLHLSDEGLVSYVGDEEVFEHEEQELRHQLFVFR